MAASSSPAVNGTPWTLVTELGVDQVLGPDQLGELAEVHLGHEDLRVALQHLAQVGGERVEVDEVGLGDLAGPGRGPGRRRR